MAKIPKGTKVEFDAPARSLKGAKVEYDGPTPEEAATMPMPEPSRMDRILEYLKATPGRVADTATSANTLPSAAMGATFNAFPRLSAAVDAAPEVLKAATGNASDVTGAYNRSLRKLQPLYQGAVDKEPVANFAGAALSPNLLGKASVGARVGSAALGGALTSYMGGENTDDVAGNLNRAEDGAGLGGLVQSGAEGVSPVMGKVARRLRTAAGSSAVNAAGMRGGIVNQPKRAGIHTLDETGDDAIAALGNRMLDQRLIPFAGSKLAIQRRAEDLMDRTAGAAEGLRARGDALGGFDQALGVKSAAARLEARTAPSMGGNLQTARTAGPAGEFITDAANTPNTFKAADDLKRGAYRSTNWSTEAKDATVLKRETVSGYRQSMEEQLDGLIPGAGEDLRKVNEGYGLAAQTADFAEEAAGREKANSKLGWGSLMLGASGMSAGNTFSPGAGIAAGVGLPLAAHVLKTRGAAMAAPMARLGSQGAAAVSGAINQSPQLAGKAGSMLENYLRPMDDEERQKKAAANYTSQTGGR